MRREGPPLSPPHMEPTNDDRAATGNNATQASARKPWLTQQELEGDVDVSSPSMHTRLALRKLTLRCAGSTDLEKVQSAGENVRRSGHEVFQGPGDDDGLVMQGRLRQSADMFDDDKWLGDTANGDGGEFMELTKSVPASTRERWLKFMRKAKRFKESLPASTSGWLIAIFTADFDR